MRIQVLKEKDFFFIKAIGIKWVYAQWETLEEAFNNFLDVYKNIIEIKKKLILKKTKKVSDFSDFNKLEFVI